jgi:hypothetical protein
MTPRSKLFSINIKKAIIKQQYGSPTPENPILPMQPPQEQEEELSSEKDAAGPNHFQEEPVSEPTKMRRGLGDPAVTKKGAAPPNEEKRNRSQANKELFEVCKQPHDGIPVSAIRDILVKNGFNGEAMDGIYTGREGKMHEQCGPRTWIVLSWHKLENTGRYEIVSYLS